MVTQEIIRYWFDYNEKTGILTRKFINEIDKTSKMYNTRFAGTSPTSKDSKGYLTARLLSKTYKVARLIFMYMEGYWPIQVDHINRIRDDNRWCNLREATNQQNYINRGKYNKNKSSSKLPGVSLHRATGKWRAQIAINGNKKHLGLFITEKEAHIVYKKEHELLTI